MTAGITAPAGVVLVESTTWFDGPTVITNSGGSLTANGPLTTTGAVNMNGQAQVGGAPANDLGQTLVPSSYGLLDYNFPYVWATGVAGAATTAGLLYLTKIPMAGGTKITNLWFKINTAASGITAAQNFGGIYSSAGKLLATTADLSTVIGTNTGPIQAALTTPYTTTGPDNFYIGFFFNAGTTLPLLNTYVGFTAATTDPPKFGSATTFGNTAAKFPYVVSATAGNTTAMPTSITMSSNTATGAFVFWAGVN